MNLDTGNIPELEFFENWKIHNKSKYTSILENYEGLIQNILDISKEDINKISEARKFMQKNGIKLHSASTLFTPDFILNIQENSIRIKKILENVFNFESKETINTLDNLQLLLENGSQIAQNSDSIPNDGDKIWDSVIWGHTQANDDVDKEVLVHFLFSHYLSQYMNNHLGSKYLLTKKDDFINILADIILLKQTNSVEKMEIYRIWSTPKSDGGLGWLDGKQLEAYKSIIK